MWLIYAFLTALFTFFHDILIKKITREINVYVVTWGWMVFSLPLLYFILLKEGVPVLGPDFYKAVLTSAGILSVALIFYTKAIEASDLSITIPILTFTPIFLLISSPVMLREFPKAIGILGVFLIVMGGYLLKFTKKNASILEPVKRLFNEKGPRYMLVVAVLFSISANIDKIGVRNSSPVMWAAAIYTVVAVVFSFVILFKVKKINRQIMSGGLSLILIGVCNAIAFTCQMKAISLTLVPYLIAVKRSSAVMSSLYGLFVLKEEGIKERLVGVSLMVLGVICVAAA